MTQTTPENKLEQINPRKTRYEIGQFFTPGPIADFMAEAVLEIDPQTVVDPGIGGGILLRSVGPRPKRFGCDVDHSAVRLARQSLGSQGGEIEVRQGSFIDLAEWPLSIDSFDAVIANPPYIRHHNLSPQEKALAKHYSTIYGTSVSGLSGSYAYFFLEAIQRLRIGGRLVFITPAEFLDVRYGSAVKEILLSHCEINEILVLQMDELAFDGVLTTSAITIATRTDEPSGSVRLSEGVFDGESIQRRRHTDVPRIELLPKRPWTQRLPSREERIKPLLKGRGATLGDYATVRRGIATGDNSFFCLTQDQADQWGLEEEFLVPVILGAKDLPPNGEALTREHWEWRKAEGSRSWLLWCRAPKEQLAGTAILRYLEHGEAEEVHKRFNCRARVPWYAAENVKPADFFATYMSREQARFVRNEAGVRCMTSLLNIWAKPGIEPDALRPSLEDEANARIIREFGRTYGGGLGKIEPRELLELPIRAIDLRDAA